MLAAETNPDSYHAADEMFTPDRKAIYGALLLDEGKRYGPEINGARQQGWGEGQHEEFQRTPAFLALQSEKLLIEAIDARRTRASRQRMAFWMQELTEITLLDFIFGQQDRVGNIDYVDEWNWNQKGKVKSRPAREAAPPSDIAGYRPLRLKRTWLNDNDAGVRVDYANYTEKTHMLEKIRHYNADLYRRLIRLNDDFQKQGPLFSYTKESLGLTEPELDRIAKHVALAAQTLESARRAGQLHFDLNPEEFFLRARTEEQKVDCGKP